MDSGYIASRMLRSTLVAGGCREKQKNSEVGVNEENAEDPLTRRQTIGCGHPEGNVSKENAMNHRKVTFPSATATASPFTC